MSEELVSEELVSEELVSDVDVDSDEAPVSVDVAVPEEDSPDNDEVNTIEVFAKSPSTTPASVKDVDSPFASGAK